MEKTDEAISGFIGKLTEFGEQYGQEAFDIAMQAVTLEGVRGLVLGAAVMVLAIALLIGAFTCCRKAIVAGYDEIGYAIGSLVCGLFGGVSVIVSMERLFDIWNWYAIFSPEIAAAHRLMGL